MTRCGSGQLRFVGELLEDLQSQFKVSAYADRLPITSLGNPAAARREPPAHPLVHLHHDPDEDAIAQRDRLGKAPVVKPPMDRAPR